MFGGCGLAVVWGLFVVSSSGCCEVSDPACSVVGWWGSAVVWIPVVVGGLGVIDICGFVVGTSVFEMCGVNTVVGDCVPKSVFAVVAVAAVVKVDCG